MGGLRLIPQPLVIAFSMRFWVLYNGIAVLNTDGIVEPPDRAGTAPKVSEFPVTVQIDRVPDDVVMDMGLVDMGTDHKAREQRRRPTKMGEMGMFSGLAYCADCGAKLYHCRAAAWTHEQECYTCSTYRGKKGCSAHYIRAVVLERLVLQNLQRVVAYAQEDEDEFIRRVMAFYIMP